MGNIGQILRILPDEIKCDLDRKGMHFDRLNELRIRVDRLFTMIYDGREITGDTVISQKHISQIIEAASNYSLYAYEQDFRQGFITIAGGHRIGIAGHVIMENNRVKNFNYITFLCVRIAHEIKGCADAVMPFVLKCRLKHTLIISPPGCGKTTLLRDIVRQISDNDSIAKSISLMDERSEIASCYRGIPQNDVGKRTDVLDACPKSEAMMMAIRSMSPGIIAVDEIGGIQDTEAIQYCIKCGCTMIGTIHGFSVRDICEKPFVNTLIGQGFFDRMIVLSDREGKGRIEECFELPEEY